MDILGTTWDEIPKARERDDWRQNTGFLCGSQKPPFCFSVATLLYVILDHSRAHVVTSHRRGEQSPSTLLWIAWTAQLGTVGLLLALPRGPLVSAYAEYLADAISSNEMILAMYYFQKLQSSHRSFPEVSKPNKELGGKPSNKYQVNSFDKNLQ